MKKKNKRGKKLLLLLAVLVLVGAGAVIALKQSEKRAQEEADAATATEETEEYVVCDIPKEDCIRIEWTAEGVSRSFKKEDGVWKNEQNASMKVDQEEFDSLVGRICGMTSDKIVSIGDPKEAGFETSGYQCTVYTKDRSMTIRYGNINKLADRYYAENGEDGNVYLVTIISRSVLDKTDEQLSAEE